MIYCNPYIYHLLNTWKILPSYIGLFLDSDTTAQVFECIKHHQKWLSENGKRKAVIVKDPHVTTQFIGGLMFFHKKPVIAQWEALSALDSIGSVRRFEIDRIVSGVLPVSATDPKKGIGGATVAFGKLYDEMGKEITASHGCQWHVTLELYGGVPPFRSPEVLTADVSDTCILESAIVVGGHVKAFPFV